MTREEEIDAMARRYTDNIPAEIDRFCKENMYSAYVVGAMWADEHPKNVWHNKSERPKLGEFVVFEELIEGKHKYYSLFRWDHSLEVGYLYNSDITRWAYIEDLLPKEIRGDR